MSAARTRVRLRPWRTSPSSSDDDDDDEEEGAEEGAEGEEEEGAVVDATETTPPDEDDATADDEEEGADVGASTLLHPSITKAHRGPLTWNHPPQVVSTRMWSG